MNQFRKATNQLRKVSLIAAFMLLLPYAAQAQTSSSPSYQVQEVQFGSGGAAEVCSGDYCAQTSIGANAVGRQSSTNFDADAGLLTDNEPYLEMVVNGGLLDLGNLTITSTAYGSATFYVRTYLTSGYTVVTASQAPTSENGATIPGLVAPTTPAPGTEQFGINLVDNSSPDVGANPVNQPDGSYADGSAAPGYDIPNQFKYVAGDVIARSATTAGNQAVGHTDYTISYIANIGGTTSAGVYQMHHDLVAVPTF